MHALAVLHAAPPSGGPRERIEATERLMPQEQAARNRRATALVLAFMFGLLWTVIFAVGWIWGTPPYFSAGLGIVVAAAYIWISSSFSVQSVIAATRARPANPENRAEKLLQYRVEEMAIAAGLPPPKVYVQDSRDINAFATGLKPEESIVCVTTGALELLNQEELEGVIAHEVSHILNRDMRLATITIGVVGAIALIAEIAIRSLWFGGGRGRGGGKNAGPLILVALVLVVLAPIFSRLAYLLMSRQREYLADASGALLTRNPESLAGALEKIRNDAPDDPKGSRTAAGLYFANPWTRLTGRSLWSTHPPLEERIRRLRGM